MAEHAWWCCKCDYGEHEPTCTNYRHGVGKEAIEVLKLLVHFTDTHGNCCFCDQYKDPEGLQHSGACLIAQHVMRRIIEAEKLQSVTEIIPFDTTGSIRYIFDEIVRERMAQDEKWGGSSHDDGHARRDWICFIEEHSRRGKDKEQFRKQMIRVAALAVAAIQSFDRGSMGR